MSTGTGAEARAQGSDPQGTGPQGSDPRGSDPRGSDPGAVSTRAEFAAALTAVREAAGLTVRQVARATGISASTVGGYYSGRHLPPLRPDGGVRAILQACGVTDPHRLDTWQRTVARIRRGPGPRPGGLPPAFPGLRPYTAADAARFHGREAELHALWHAVLRARRTGGITALV